MLHTSPTLDGNAQRLARTLRDTGIVQIADFLPDQAANTLFGHLKARQDWHQILNYGDKVAELSQATLQQMTASQRADLDNAVYAAAREGFQYRYSAIRVPDDQKLRQAQDDPLTQFAELMSESARSGLIGQVLDRSDLRFADAQATAYAPGDFLTGHDDAIEGKGRVAAYVMGLTPIWRLEWGGLLLLHSADGAHANGFCPIYNTITIFRVPVMHSVSEVTRAAPFRRMSITGWLRTNEPDA